jgi:transcriptional regulator with XRE-family HTH domain
MSKPATDPFDKRFADRIQAIREEMGWKQKDMAEVLAIPLERYKKYEGRTPLPHRLISLFCKVTGVPEAQLFDLDVPVTRLPIRRAPGAGERNARH